MPRQVTRSLARFLQWYGSEPFNETPGLADDIQTVVIADDQSHLVAPAPVPKRAVYPGTSAAIVGEYSGFEIEAVAPCAVLVGANVSGWRYRVRTSGTWITTGRTEIVNGFSGNSPRNKVYEGSSTINPVSMPQVMLGTSGFLWDYPFVLLAGEFLSFVEDSANTSLLLRSIAWQEIPDTHDPPLI